MIGNRNTLTALAFVAVMLTAAFAGPMATTASAQSDDSGVIDTLFTDDEDDTSRWATISAFAGGVVEKYNPLAGSDKADATEYSEDVQSTFNSHNDTLLQWANARSTASEDADVARLKFTDKSGNSKYMFVVADVNTTTGNYTSVRMMNLTEFKDTDRTHDHTFRLSPFASRNAADELDTFITEYAEPNEGLNRSELARLSGKYRGEITGTELPGE